MKVREGFEYFKCRHCGTIIREDQRPYDEKGIVYPLYCHEDQGGCGQKSKFLRLKKEYVENPEKFREKEKK